MVMRFLALILLFVLNWNLFVSASQETVQNAPHHSNLLPSPTTSFQGNQFLVHGDLNSGLWHDVKRNANRNHDDTFIREGHGPESADQDMVPKISTDLTDSDPDEPSQILANVMHQQECFSPLASVQVQDKGRVAMEELRVGDRVLTSSGNYQTVYLMDQVNASKTTEYLQIYTWARHKPLEVSPYRMIFVDGQADPIPAIDIKVGHRLRLLTGLTSVIRINVVLREGLYNPLTMDGTIVVDGIIASTYSAVCGASHLVEIARWKVVSCQTMIHFLLQPLRIIAWWQPQLFQQDSADEVHWYGRIGRLLASRLQNYYDILYCATRMLWCVGHGAFHVLCIVSWCLITFSMLYMVEQFGKMQATKA